MQDRRRDVRQRVIYGGVLAYNDRFSTMDCVVRNFTASGAKIALPANAILPDRLALRCPSCNAETVGIRIGPPRVRKAS